MTRVIRVGTPGSPGPLAASVVNAAALSAIATSTFPVGAFAYVSSLDRFYRLLPSDTRTPDNLNVIAASGGGNWVATGAPGAATISVASIAALQAFNPILLNPGATAYVLPSGTVGPGSTYIYSPTDTQTSNGSTIVSASGGGNWLLASGLPTAVTVGSGIMDLQSLIYGDVADAGWSQVTPSQSVGITPSPNGIAQLDGYLDQVLVNYGANARGNGVIERPFVVPPGVTSVRLVGTMALPTGVSSASVQLQITEIYPSSSTLTTSTVSLTALMAAYATSSVSVSSSGGTGLPVVYLARAIFNGSGQQAQALITRLQIQVVTSTDPFWLFPFTRIEPLPHLLKNNGYFNQRIQAAWGVPAYYWFVSPHSQLEFDTTATTIAIEWANDINSVPGSAQFRIDVNGRFYQLVNLSGTTNTLSVSKITLPFGNNRVTITWGGYTGGATATSLSGVAFCVMTALYLNAGATFTNVSQAKARNQWVIYGDSKLCGQRATSTLVSGLPSGIRRKLPGDAAFDAWGGRSLSDESLSNVNAETARLMSYAGRGYVVGIGRNDWSNVTWANAAAFGTRFGQLLDALHAARADAQIVVATCSPENTENANANGYSLADIRAQQAGAMASRTSFCSLVDLSTLWPIGAGSSNYLADGVHPNDLGQALVVDALSGPDGFGIEAGPITGPQSIPGCVADIRAMAAIQSSGVITGLPDLTGTISAGLSPTNSPTLLATDFNGHPAMQFVAGSSQTLASAIGTVLFTNAVTVAIVQKFASTSGNPVSFNAGTEQGGDVNGFGFWATGDGHRAIRVSGATYSEDGLGPSTSAYEIIVIQWVNGSQVAMYVNGVQQSMQALTAFAPMDANSRLTLGGTWTGSAFAQYASVSIECIAIWKNLISAAAVTAFTRLKGNMGSIVVP